MWVKSCTHLINQLYSRYCLTDVCLTGYIVYFSLYYVFITFFFNVLLTHHGITIKITKFRQLFSTFATPWEDRCQNLTAKAGLMDMWQNLKSFLPSSKLVLRYFLSLLAMQQQYFQIELKRFEIHEEKMSHLATIQWNRNICCNHVLSTRNDFNNDVHLKPKTWLSLLT